MALAVGSILEISLNMRNQGENVFNVWQYRIDTLSGSPAADEWGEAWWDEVKETYRGIAATSANSLFFYVNVRDITDPLGIYGQFTVPLGEQQGTRSNAGLGDSMPSFVACGVRLAVGTRATRPGQKRFSFLHEADVAGQAIQAAYLTAVAALMEVMTAPLTLAAPAASCVLQPVVVSKGDTGLAVAEQDIVGYSINPYTDSQVSRKRGHGAD